MSVGMLLHQTKEGVSWGSNLESGETHLLHNKTPTENANGALKDKQMKYLC